MKNLTMYLPGFSHRLGGRRALPAVKKVLGQSAALDGLATLVGRFVPAGVFAMGEEQRDRVFTPWVTFVAFLGQVLTRGSACREAVRRVQAWCVVDKRAVPSESTGRARKGQVANVIVESYRVRQPPSCFHSPVAGCGIASSENQ